MKRACLTLIAISAMTHPLHAQESIFDVYRAIGDTEYFPLVETLDGHTISNSFDWRLDTRIEEQSNFLAYLEEGAGWSVTAYKFWPLADGGAIAATSSASFEGDVMYPDTYVEFFARSPEGVWGEIDAPMPFIDPSDFLARSVEPNNAGAQDMLEATDWALYYELGPDTDLLTVRLTAANSDKCWPEKMFGFATGNPPVEGELDFCRDVYSGLTTELRFELDPGTGRFEIRSSLPPIMDTSNVPHRCGPLQKQNPSCGHND